MTNLTDKWKKSELPEGWYYVKGNRAEGIYAYTAEYLNNMYRPRNSERIVEQVPSFEELQNQAFILKSRESEIVKLKELLKECVEYVKKDYGDYLTYTQSAIYQEIKQVLGEE